MLLYMNDTAAMRIAPGNERPYCGEGEIASRRIRKKMNKIDLAAVVTGEGPNLKRTTLVAAN